MAILEAFEPPGPFKEGHRKRLELEYLPPRTLNKQRRPEVCESDEAFNRTCADYSQVSTTPVESHAFFVAMFLNEDGSLQMKSSGQLRRYERHILEEAQHKFKDVLENYIEHTGMCEGSGPYIG